MKEENLGKKCVLRVLRSLQKPLKGGVPEKEDYFPFTIIGICHGGYLITRIDSMYSSCGGTFKVKTKDIIIV